MCSRDASIRGQSKRRFQQVPSLWSGAGCNNERLVRPVSIRPTGCLFSLLNGRHGEGASKREPGKKEMVKKPQEGPIDAASRWMVLLSGQTSKGEGERTGAFPLSRGSLISNQQPIEMGPLSSTLTLPLFASLGLRLSLHTYTYTHMHHTALAASDSMPSHPAAPASLHSGVMSSIAAERGG